MSLILKIIFMVFALGLWAPKEISAAQEQGILAETERYRVVLSGEGEPRFDPVTGGRVMFTFLVTEKATGRQYPIVMDNITSRIQQIRIFGGKLVVLGEEATLQSGVVTLIGLEDRREIDLIMGFWNKVSSTGRYVSYRKFYPPQTAEPAKMSDLVLIYDLADSSGGNRLQSIEAYRNDPVGRLTEVGHPVYPEDSVGKNHYRVWVREEQDRHSVLPGGFFWLDNDRKLIFGDQMGGQSFLIVVDISKGLSAPLIQKKKIDTTTVRESVELVPQDGDFEAPAIRIEEVRLIDSKTIQVRLSSQIPLKKKDQEFSLDLKPALHLPSSEDPLQSFHSKPQ